MDTRTPSGSQHNEPGELLSRLVVRCVAVVLTTTMVAQTALFLQIF